MLHRVDPGDTYQLGWLGQEAGEAGMRGST